MIDPLAPRVLVSVESPLRGQVPEWVAWAWLASLIERFNRRKNMRYALLCVRDSLARGEAPYASHVFFDRRGLLNDADPYERRLGMEAGLSWSAEAAVFAFYIDRGFSSGMSAAHLVAIQSGATISVRSLQNKLPPGAP